MMCLRGVFSITSMILFSVWVHRLCGSSKKRLQGYLQLCLKKKTKKIKAFAQLENGQTLAKYGPGRRASSTLSRIDGSIPRPARGGYKRAVEGKSRFP